MSSPFGWRAKNLLSIAYAGLANDFGFHNDEVSSAADLAGVLQEVDYLIGCSSGVGVANSETLRAHGGLLLGGEALNVGSQDELDQIGFH